MNINEHIPTSPIFSILDLGDIKMHKTSKIGCRLWQTGTLPGLDQASGLNAGGASSVMHLERFTWLDTAMKAMVIHGKCNTN